jgi:putative ABC transport system permease protein
MRWLKVRGRRAFAWLSGLSLDLRLGLRMLARYPWLTLVGGAALAFGVAAGVGAFELRTQLVSPSLPLDEGSRIVGLRVWDASESRPHPTRARIFDLWRDRVTTVEDLSAFSTFSRNLITDDGRSELETVAAVTAGTFRVTRVSPLLGRVLLDADELPGAPPVLVLGHSLWKQRFSGDPGVVGQLVRLGGEPATIVGVMSEGFAFPVAHQLWAPLRLRTADAGRDDVTELHVFGRLARGVSKERAEAALGAIDLGDADDRTERREHLRSQLVPYTWLVADPSGVRLGVALGNAFVLMLLLLVAANVALLLFARAASREAEIALRSALGASRSRIVGQLFVEALVLASVALAAGLSVAGFGVRSFVAMNAADSGQPVPFWVSGGLTPTTVIYAAVLMLVTAVIIGVLPALNVTGRVQQTRLRQATTMGAGFRFGGLWTAVIVAQVAVTLTFPATAFFFHRWMVEGQTRNPGFAVSGYLSARLELDRMTALVAPREASEDAFRTHLRRTYGELERRVLAEPEVAGLTFADHLPGTLHSRWRVEIEGGATPVTPTLANEVATASVALNFFDVLGTPVSAGRTFTGADLESVPHAVVVNQSFVTHVLGGQNPVGRRVRRVAATGSQTPGPWLEIVGVVRDLGMVGAVTGAGLYQPTLPEDASALRVAIRLKSDPQAFANRLRSVAGAVDPALQIHELMPLDEAGADLWLESQFLSRVMVGLSAIALLLSLTAIYAVTAFTVSRRTREIGLRVALGADRRHVIGEVLRRPLAQVGLGVVVGGLLVTLTFTGLFESTPTGVEAALIAAYSLVMMGVCLLACVTPARRALSVAPAAALTSES